MELGAIVAALDEPRSPATDHSEDDVTIAGAEIEIAAIISPGLQRSERIGPHRPVPGPAERGDEAGHFGVMASAMAMTAGFAAGASGSTVPKETDGVLAGVDCPDTRKPASAKGFALSALPT